MSIEKNCLYIVATPIGNLGDLSQRAIKILSEVDIIAAEDTRHSGILLSHYAIHTKCTALHEHNEHKVYNNILTLIDKHHAVALISDAGTPLISDPGYILVQQAKQAGIRVIPVPGACALISALSVSGLPSDKFSYYGFLPAKQQARINMLQSLATVAHTLIFYESPHRIVRCLFDMLVVFGPQRRICVAREISKTFETIHTTTLESVCEWVESDTNQQKGEIVLLLEGKELPSKQQISEQDSQILTILLAELSTKKAAEVTSKITGTAKNALYSKALQLQVANKQDNL